MLAFHPPPNLLVYFSHLDSGSVHGSALPFSYAMIVPRTRKPAEPGSKGSFASKRALGGRATPHKRARSKAPRLAIATQMRLGDPVLQSQEVPMSLRTSIHPVRMHAPLHCSTESNQRRCYAVPEFTMNQATPNQPPHPSRPRLRALPTDPFSGTSLYTRDGGSCSAEKHIDNFIHNSEHQVRTVETKYQYELARGTLRNNPASKFQLTSTSDCSTWQKSAGLPLAR